MTDYLQTAIEHAMGDELTQGASGGTPGSPTPPRPAPAPAAAAPPAPGADANARADVLRVRDTIKAAARVRAQDARTVAPSSKFYRRLGGFYLREYLAGPTAARGAAACETKIGKAFAGPATAGDAWEDGALRFWNHQPIPDFARRMRPALPAQLAAATDILSRPNRKVLPFIDVPHLIGEANMGTGFDADVAGGGKNISQLMHWGTGVKYSQIDALTMRELFLAYELWHLEAWDVFGEDPINDLIAEEGGRLLGVRLRASAVSAANLRAELDAAFGEARAWVGTLLRPRLAALDGWTVAEAQRRANIWYGAQPAMDVWGADTLFTMLRRGMSVSDVAHSPLADRITGIYALIYGADAWEAARGAIDNGTFIPAMLGGSFDGVFERMAKGQPVVSFESMRDEGRAVALEAPIEGYRLDATGTTCSGGPTPGATALRDELTQRFAGRGEIYNCRPVRGGRRLSLHGEGRAVDWYRSAADAAQAAEAQRIIDWLLGADAAGNAHALARRMGVQELIWNRRIWSASRYAEGWRDYSGQDPHTTHLHIGLNRAGAARQTSHWVAAPAGDVQVPAGGPPVQAGPSPAARTQPHAAALESGPPSSSGLTWVGGTEAQLAFKRRVYDVQVARSRRIRGFVAEVPRAELAAIAQPSGRTGVLVRTAAAAASGRLLAEAATALADARARGDAIAAAAEPLSVSSGYRSVAAQFASWNANFTAYYDQTRARRTAAPGGEHGEQAAELTARYVGSVLSAPGFSLHNNGLAVDLATRQGATQLGARTAQRAAWRASWAWTWLSVNAARFDLFQNAAIDEPWHWEHRPPAANPVVAPVSLAAFDAVALGAIAAGEAAIPVVGLLAAHHDVGPDMVLRWNAMADLSAGVDVVVHLHGFSGNRRLRLEDQKLPISGLDLVPPVLPPPLQRQLRAPAHPAWTGRMRPTLLILPRGRARPGHPAAYDFPALVAPQGFEGLVDAALRAFELEVGAVAGATTARRVVLTAHSGGGAALDVILQRTADTALDPSEVHVFDALYGRPVGLRGWVDRRLRNDLAQLAAAPSVARPPSALAGALRVLHLRARPGTDPATQRPWSSTEPASLEVARAIRGLLPAGSAHAAALAQRYRVEVAATEHSLIAYWYGGRLLADAGAVIAHP